VKKLLLILFCLPLLFTTCKKEDDNTPTNNTGNNVNTFLSNNDGTVWVCQDQTHSMSTFLGGDSLIGFYNANNFVYHIYKEKWGEECNWLSEQYIEDNGMYSNIEIITNTPNELEVIIEFGYIGSPPTPYMRRRITTMGQNQLLNEGFMTDSLGQEHEFSSNYGKTYIRSTTLQNLSCD